MKYIHYMLLFLYLVYNTKLLIENWYHYKNM